MFVFIHEKVMKNELNKKFECKNQFYN